jgi:uncharacterized repeat protein (TIGR01451 family)
MINRQRTAAVVLTILLGALAVAQQPQTREPPIAPGPGAPGIRDIPTPQPGVRDVPTPATPPRRRILPGPVAPEPQCPSGTYCPVDPPAPVVTIKVRVPACAEPNEELEYRIHVENLSKMPAHHVIVRNPVPANATFVRATPPPSASDPVLEWRLGTLDGCASRDIVLVLKPTGAGDVNNCARVVFEHGECVLTKIAGQPAPAEPKLTVRKMGPDRATLNKPLDYKLIVSNLGTEPVRDIRLTDTMDRDLRHIATNKSELEWGPFDLAAGESKTFDYQLTAVKSGRLCNRAVLTAGSLRKETSSCVEIFATEVERASGLTFAVEIADNPVEVKQPTRYTITVRNTGSAPANDIEITADVPKQMQITEVLPKESYRQLMQEITFFPLKTLAAGETRRFIIDVIPSAVGADVRIKVRMKAKELIESVTKEAQVNIVPGSEPPIGK